MSLPMLFVPPVPPGDQGLVLEVNGVSPEPRSNRWYIVTLEGHTFGLPQILWPWAMELDAQTRRREVRMPAMFAFRRVGETVDVERISA